jgi:hypothetical protein
LFQSDQVTLLKGAILEIIILRSTLFYDPNSNALHQGDFSFKMDMLKKLLSADDELWDNHIRCSVALWSQMWLFSGKDYKYEFLESVAALRFATPGLTDGLGAWAGGSCPQGVERGLV